MKLSLNPIAKVRTETHFGYDVFLNRGCLYDIIYKIRNLNRVKNIFLITDANVDRLYARRLATRIELAGFRVIKFVFEPKRKKKSLDTASDIFQLLFDNNADRHTLVLNVGGGTVGDLGGFVAALYLRGVRYIHVPTTLLSQADSGVGGKVNVNFGPHINCLSVFHHPVAVWIDPEMLQTLPPREYRSGLAEIVKYASILDPQLFVLLERNRESLAVPNNKLIETVIRRCIERKCKIVTKDPNERGAFRFFNYGHELGHAVEVTYDYEHLLHGEAVSIGMVASSWMGVQAGLTDPSLLRRQCELLAALGLPTAIPKELRNGNSAVTLGQRIERMLFTDKKRTPEGLLWIVPTRLGKGVCTTQIKADLVGRCVQRLAEGVVD